MTKKVVAEKPEFTVTAVLSSMTKVMKENHLKDLSIEVGNAFTTKKGTTGYSIELVDISKSITKGFIVMGYAYITKEGQVFIPNLNKLIMRGVAYSNKIKAPLDDIFANGTNDPFIKDGFRYVPHWYNGKVACTITFIDPTSPFFLGFITAFIDESGRISPYPTRSGVVNFNWGPKNQKAMTIVSSRDDKGQLMKDKEGNIIEEYGKINYYKDVRDILGHLSCVQERFLIDVIGPTVVKEIKKKMKKNVSVAQ